MELSNLTIFGFPKYDKGFTCVKQEDLDKKEIANLIVSSTGKKTPFNGGID